MRTSIVNEFIVHHLAQYWLAPPALQVSFSVRIYCVFYTSVCVHVSEFLRIAIHLDEIAWWFYFILSLAIRAAIGCFVSTESKPIIRNYNYMQLLPLLEDMKEQRSSCSFLSVKCVYVRMLSACRQLFENSLEPLKALTFWSTFFYKENKFLRERRICTPSTSQRGIFATSVTNIQT